MKRFYWGLIFTLVFNLSQGQTQPKVIDLATLSSGEGSVIDIDAPATLSINIINSLYPFKTKYIVAWEYSKLDELGDPLIYTSPEQTALPSFPAMATVGNDPCKTTYKKWLDNITSETDEKQLPKDLVNAEKEIKAVCKDSTPQINALRELTIVRDFLVHEIDPGWQLTIDILRNDGSNTKWRITYRSKVFNHWRVYYGASFVFNMMSPVTTYFSQATDSNTYVITAKPSDHVVTFRDFAPVVFYTWIPERTYSHLTKSERAKLKLDYCFPGWHNFVRIVFAGNKLYRVGYSFGLNANLAKPSVFASPSLIIGNNVSLSFGATIYPKYHLRDQYHPDQVIGESLDFEQLHQLGWYGEWFVCLAFRFNAPPFIQKPDR